MLKYICIIFSICFISSVAYSEDKAILKLFEDESSDNKSKSKEQIEKDESFFSFMDFKLPENMFTLSKDDKGKNKTFTDTVKSAERGDVQAQLALGYAHLYGRDGVQIDYQKAFKYYGMAALQNDPIGINNLGSLYYGGLGVKKNFKKAAILFKKAIELGNFEASVNLGFMHASGNGAQKDIKLALDYLEKALTTNNPAAKFMVGYAYYKGINRQVDYSKASKLLKESADAGFDEAQKIIADLYIKGHGFPQNYNNAIYYLNKAIEQGDAASMVKLGDILFEGKKYNKDIKYAHVLYNLASVRGIVSASDKRSKVEGIMKVDEVLVAQKKAEIFKEELSSVTSYIRQTYGENIISYFN